MESDEEGEPAVTESDVEAFDAVNRGYIAPSPSTVPPAPSAPPATIDQAQQELSGLSQHPPFVPGGGKGVRRIVGVLGRRQKFSTWPIRINPSMIRDRPVAIF